MTDEDLERLRLVVREMRAELYAMRALMPVLLAHASVTGADDPPGQLRDLHDLASRTADELIAEEAGDLREQVATALDRIFTSVRLERLGP